MARVGTVLERKGNLAEVITNRRGICDGCSDKSNCSFDAALGEGREEIVTVVNPVNADRGELVEFDLSGHTELKVSLIVWTVPLLGIVFGAMAGAAWHQMFRLSMDMGTLLGAVFGISIAFLIVFTFERRYSNSKNLMPLIIRRVGPENSCSHLPEIRPAGDTPQHQAQ